MRVAVVALTLMIMVGSCLAGRRALLQDEPETSIDSHHERKLLDEVDKHSDNERENGHHYIPRNQFGSGSGDNGSG
ncbi:hypothetical protein JCGZ_05488 [Jatropha curcas]|uniref:Uncharacterized protein n=1 Tax=Jatropha curcas TaxID=180498 RepID=A0A067L6B8_JATCU|nr:hypothetical protein JCGZ_05488 [Jatropha curcas]